MILDYEKVTCNHNVHMLVLDSLKYCKYLQNNAKYPKAITVTIV